MFSFKQKLIFILKLLNNNCTLCLDYVNIEALQMFFYKKNLNDNVNIIYKHKHVFEF